MAKTTSFQIYIKDSSLVKVYCDVKFKNKKMKQRDFFRYLLDKDEEIQAFKKTVEGIKLKL